MNLTLLQLSLLVLQNTLQQYQVAKAPVEVIDGIQAAIASLTQVQGTDVTFGQVEGLRVKVPWSS